MDCHGGEMSLALYYCLVYKMHDTDLNPWAKDTQGSDPNDNSLCGKRIMISIGDKSTTVIVADRCAGCAEWDLDLTPTTFDYIVSGGQGVGRTTASWYFVD